MRLQKNLPGLVMLAAGFACGVVVTLMFNSCANSPTLLEPAGTSSLEEMRDCKSRLRGCVCDKEAEKLKRLARLVFLRSKLNTSCERDSMPPLTPQNMTDLRKFIYPDSQNLSPGVPLGVPKLLNQEYVIKDPLLIGILTQEEYLHTRAQTVYDTWAQDVERVVFFVGEDCKISANISHLPIIKLKGIPDHVYPPLKKAFAVMQYMYDHFINQYNWFIRADDDMYVRGELLLDLLKKMSPYERIYLGRAGVGKSDDLDRLHLLPHERYCMGGPGVVFSNAALRAVGPYLNECLDAVFLHDEQSTQKWNDDDVEIGRCISRKLDFQCSTSAESRLKFHTDYAGDSLQPINLWSKPIFRDIISLHPVKNPVNMLAIHHFYKTLEFEHQYEQLFDLTSYTNKLCKSLPEHLLPPGFISTTCNLKISYRLEEESIGWLGSYLVNRNTSVLCNPATVYDTDHWTFFNGERVFAVSSISPQHPFKLSFQAELNHLQKLLHKYFARKKELKDYQLVEIVHGYTRFLPVSGSEYILRLKLAHGEKSESVKFSTVRLLRRLSPEIAISEQLVPSGSIHVLLPLNLVDDKFREFLKNFVQQGLSKGVSLSLVVVIFSESDADLVGEIVKQHTHGYPKAQVTIAIADGKYSFPRAVDVGMTVLKKDDLVFVTDLNFRMKHDFWTRCRENTELRKQAYFPIPFSVYTSDFKALLVKDATSYPINEWSGKWDFYSFKSFCIVKQDYTEAVDYKKASSFFEQLIHSNNVQVFQAPDPSLYQFWPDKTCDSLDTLAKRKTCNKLQIIPSQFPQPELTKFLIEQNSKRSFVWGN